jgi:hypothetical protein
MVDYEYYIGKQVKTQIILSPNKELFFSGIVKCVDSKFLVLTDKFGTRQMLPLDKITYVSEIAENKNDI